MIPAKKSFQPGLRSDVMICFPFTAKRFVYEIARFVYKPCDERQINKIQSALAQLHSGGARKNQIARAAIITANMRGVKSCGALRKPCWADPAKRR